MRRLALLAMVIVLSACSGSTGAAPGSGANGAAGIAPSLDRSDQPSFANRTGRPPALSLQELFHPAYNVPVDPSRIRTLLVTGDVIPARGVAYFAAVRHDYLWPFWPPAAHTKNADTTYINRDAPLIADCPVSPT